MKCKFNYNKFILLFIISILNNCICLTQNLINSYSDIEVEFKSDKINNPFSGGFNQSRISLIDVTGDTLPELFVLNYTSPNEQIKVYLNKGKGKFVEFYNSEYKKIKAKSWIRFIDIDFDGDIDFFTSGELSELLVYYNNGTTKNPIFNTKSDTLKGIDNSTIVAQQITIPNFVDIDFDGDYDLFIGNLDGTITYYQNIGTNLKANFKYITSQYSGIHIISNINLDIRKNSLQDGLHGSSCIEFADMDSDGDYDFFFSDFFLSHILYFENKGSKQNAKFSPTIIDTGKYVDAQSYTQIISSDIDNDGDNDLICSSLLNSTYQTEVIFYKNIGSNLNPIFQEYSLNSLVNFLEELDFGSFSSPTVIKDKFYNGLLIGDGNGRLWLFDVTQNLTPKLTFKNLVNVSTTNYYVTPAVGDLDNDSISEVVLGNSEGTLSLYKFEGKSLKQIPWQLDSFKVNQNSSPCLVDFDNDGDLDLFVGAGNGKVVYFNNTGTKINYVFQRIDSKTLLETFDVGFDSSPRFGDIDNDGDLDLIIGGRGINSSLNKILIYLNQNHAFSSNDTLPTITSINNPVPLVLNFKNGNYLLSGNLNGGINVFKYSKDVISVKEEFGINFFRLLLK